MKKIILLIVVLALCSCNNHDEVKYINKEYSIDVRLDDLMSRMTLEEKVAQMTQFVGLITNKPMRIEFGVKYWDI